VPSWSRSKILYLDAVQHHPVATGNGGLNLVMDQDLPDWAAGFFLHHFILICLGKKRAKFKILSSTLKMTSLLVSLHTHDALDGYVPVPTCSRHAADAHHSRHEEIDIIVV
jgi:hypothetical protein